jgi:hypothetical protein
VSIIILFTEYYNNKSELFILIKQLKDGKDRYIISSVSFRGKERERIRATARQYLTARRSCTGARRTKGRLPAAQSVRPSPVHHQSTDGMH